MEYRVAISPETRSKSKQRPPTASSAGDESRRWRTIVERPRDAEMYSTRARRSPTSDLHPRQTRKTLWKRSPSATSRRGSGLHQIMRVVTLGWSVFGDPCRRLAVSSPRPLEPPPAFPVLFLSLWERSGPALRRRPCRRCPVSFWLSCTCCPSHRKPVWKVQVCFNSGSLEVCVRSCSLQSDEGIPRRSCPSLGLSDDRGAEIARRE